MKGVFKMVESMGGLHDGENEICRIDGKNGRMRMDISVLKLRAGADERICEAEKETAVLLVKGTVEIRWNGRAAEMHRDSEFDEDPWCLHAPKGVEITLHAKADSELVIQKAQNGRDFAAKLYAPQDCRSDVFGEGEWNGTARRIVRTVFDYSNAPYSNMVMGEVITWPGKWSSYPPHCHPQPEVYYYRFDKPQGFGLCLNGDKAYRITDNSYAAIEGGDVHPQTSAPGYAMYYCWMIRHLEDNPWKDRIVAKEHAWLCAKGVSIWPDDRG